VNTPGQVQLAANKSDALSGMNALALLPVSGSSSIQSLTPVDSNGDQIIDTTKGTGFSVKGGNLDLVSVTETTGQQRSWSAVHAHVDAMTAQGLPPSTLTLTVNSLDLLYNGADQTTGSKLNWSGITGTGANFDTGTTSMLINKIFAGITDTTDISVSGSVQLNVADTVIGF